MKKLFFPLLLVMLVSGGRILAQLTSTSPALPTVLYVSPTGSGNDFSVCKPGSLTDAKAVIRTRNTRMTQNLTVALYGGVYALDAPLQFTDADGGKNGYKIIYKPVSATDVPVLEGGKKITGWRPHSGNIWVADAADMADCRQFWVNGNRRDRASSATMYRVALWDDPATPAQTDGVTAPPGAFGNYANVDDVELQFNHYWRNSHIPVIGATDNGNGYTIRIDIDLAAHTPGAIDNTAQYRVVNAFELLDQPGEWYFNRATRQLYYAPMPGEDLTTADAYVGALDRIVDFRGSSLSNRVTNVRLEGLTLRHNTWLFPNSSRWGYLPVQSESLLFYDPSRGREWYLNMPGAVVATRTDGIELVNNQIVESGAGGIMLIGQGVDHTLVDGNVLTDVSGAGVVLSNGYHQFIGANEDNNNVYLQDDLVASPNADPSAEEAPCVGNIIRNNYISRTGVEYKASAAIAAYFPQNTDIGYNDISTIPYTGISLGWGWDFPAVNPVNKNNRIHHNRIGDYMKVLIDGGAIYTNGQQLNTEIDHNYLYDQDPVSWREDDSGTLYPDQGSNNINFHDNVLRNVNKWLHLWTSTITNNKFVNNYSTSAKEFNVGQATNLFQNNVVGISQLPAAAVDIVNGSGLPEANRAERTAGGGRVAVSSFRADDCAPCSVTANVRQSGCLGSFPSTNARPFFTLTTNPAISNGQGSTTYEVLVNGVVQGVGNYGTEAVVGQRGQLFFADNASRYQVIIRDRANLTCATLLTTTPVAPCSTVVVPSAQGNCGLTVAQFDQSVAFSNGTRTPTDDYYRIALRATANGSAAYEVVLNANADGTGGTVLNGAGTTFGKPVALSRNQVFKADGKTTVSLSVRSKDSPGCFTTVQTLPIKSIGQ